MQAPAQPADEPQRLAKLRGLSVLDTDPEERFDRYTRMAKRLFGVEIAVVSLVDANRQWFKSCAGLTATETPREVSFCGHAILEEGLFIIEDARADERFADNPLVTGAPHVRFYAGCPLRVGDGSALGTLCLIDSAPRALDAEERQILADLGAMVADELATLEMATVDELTGLSNRRSFSAIAGKALQSARPRGTPLSLIFFDLDGFKAINDTCGHDAGDEALREFARALRETFRDSDLVARLGGDELCVLLVGAAPSVAAAGVAKLRAALDRLNEQPDRRYALRCSAGIVGFDPDRHAKLADLMAAADRAMYEDKQHHRGDGR